MIFCKNCSFQSIPAAMTGTIRFLRFSNLVRPAAPAWNIGLDVGSYVKDLMRYCPENVVDQVMEHQDALLRRLGRDYLSVIAFMPYEEDGGVRYA